MRRMVIVQPAGSDIFLGTSGVDAICVPVNAKGVAGKGLAKAAAMTWPKWERSYKDCCRLGRMLGREHELHAVPIAGMGRTRHVVSVPTKYHWRESSSLELVTASVERLRDAAASRGWQRVAVPALGCGLGGLAWPLVLAIIERALTDSPTTFLIYPPESA